MGSFPPRRRLGLAAAALAVFAAGFALAAASLAAGLAAGGVAAAVPAAGAAAAAGGGAVWLLARRAARPLSALAEEAEAIRGFDLAERPLPASSIAEFDRLSGAIGGMKAALARFGIYVPRDLARKLLAEGAEARLGGERRPLSILFSDVADFTALAERLEPEELMRVASAYFEAMTAALLAHEATIDKFIGDSVMALWSAPRRDLAHAAHACRGALAARAASRRLEAEFAARGWPRFRTRFGVHSGEAVVGNVGSSERMMYTAMGRMVNLASRLEGLNKRYGTEILVSEATRRGAGAGFVFRPVDLVLPKGAAEPVEVHELLGLSAALAPEEAPLVADPALIASLRAWREVVVLYRAGRFAEAEAALAAARAPGDPLGEAYAARLAALRVSPPGEEWSPVIRFDDK
jgi:adenylate cyclase